METISPALLVTGATGNVGGALLRRLSAAGITARALVRGTPNHALPVGTTAVRGDLADPTSLDEALDGVERVFLVWPLGSTGGAAATVTRLAETVQRVVYLSSTQATQDPDADPISRMHGDLERLVRDHAAQWSLLRSGAMAANTLGWAAMVRADREVRWPYGAAGRSLVHEDDLAEVAAQALLTDALVGLTVDLTGPETLTQEQQARAIGAAIGDAVRWVELSRADAREQMLGWGWPEEMVCGALDAWSRMVAHPEAVSSDVERVLGRRATSYAQWARDHADAFR